MNNRILLGIALIFLCFAVPAAASWNSDWASREKILLNTGDDGAAIKTPVDGAQVLVRLHTGNFAFADAKPDGSDLRFIADDDKTPLKFHIEQFDSLSELALIWVTVPKLAAGNKSGYIWMYYNNPKAAPAGDPKTTYDASQAVIFHFAEKDGLPKDSTGYGNNAVESTASSNAAGLIGADVSFSGNARIVIPASPSIRVGANGVTVSMWIKPDGAAQTATLFKQSEGNNSLVLFLQGDKLVGQVGSVATAPAGTISAGIWHHVALIGKDSLTVYVDGQQVAQVATTVPALAGSVEVGQGFKGDMDEFAIAYAARDSDWIRIAALGQGMDQKLVTYAAAEGGEEPGGTSYLKILLGSVTIDGWVVIGILILMMFISFAVMITKGIFITRIGRANAEFKDRFASLSSDLTALEGDSRANQKGKSAGSNVSSMFKIYQVGIVELKKRLAVYREKKREMVLSAQAIDAIRASLDATLIRELQRMNAQMVLLTIAIAGGPFLGLLGTVVGVMITFAAIAAAGDVNVNSIAPGIAAALVATVAGLAVAIPSLFGYNYLASRIKELSTDMQVFVDEFITRLAENYSN